MTLPLIGNRDARRIFLHRHLLSDAPQGPASGNDLLQLIQGLGFVQLDSINTVARAHDLILFSRRQRYRPQALKTLYERDGALFEHWTHDAAVIPMGYYPHWELRRQRDAQMLRQRYKNWHQHDFEGRFQTVLDQIRAQGPVSSSDVGQDEPRSNGGWWDWHPSKTALEYLWRAGALCVVGRDGFQKRYDLTERVIDAALCDPSLAPDEAQTIDWCCNGALDRLGFATPGELAAFWAHISPAEAKAWVQHEQAAGRVEQVQIAGADGTIHRSFARPGLASDPAIDMAPTARLRVLSPFDPALRDRKRAERLFGFRYRIEMFVPAPKRVYGYYVFPILQGDSIIARVDMKAHRDRDTLVVRALWPEPGSRWGKGKQAAFEAELARIIRLAGVSQIAFEDGWLR
ncbi:MULTISPECIES: crosslink repair DNA glycosylase YcaQ family protein [unclassified Sulfitobacter]|uniref:winged helix-turn-helix domain-containing protein n=1 Tax=unclassified Sulfitobacter TaxID=196795 RepID=UPI0004E3569F|nr:MULTISPECIES: crosslink repair DNA glycosylase YcaQ family protein [unclassified Sulfitobacter]PTA97801.1 winged helix-turn-helix domain-containing protein [Sulfitobacter sp. CB-A]ULO20087.1 YcaQ family DNA glycosylase [Sulfitobacter sp. CB2047]